MLATLKIRRAVCNSIAGYAIAFFGIAVASSAYAMNDSVEFRMTTNTLIDSSTISYEIGAVRTPHGGYLKFQRLPNHAIISTEPFIVGVRNDSLQFCRFGFAGNKITNNIVNEIAPSHLAFDEFSSVLFIIEARNYRDHVVLARFDTVRFYCNDRHDLREYDLCGDYHCIRTVSLPHSIIGDTIEIAIEEIFDLPKTGAITNDTIEAFYWRQPCDTGDYTYSGQDVNSPKPVLALNTRTGMFDLQLTLKPSLHSLSIGYSAISNGVI